MAYLKSSWLSYSVSKPSQLDLWRPLMRILAILRKIDFSSSSLVFSFCYIVLSFASLVGFRYWSIRPSSSGYESLLLSTYSPLMFTWVLSGPIMHERLNWVGSSFSDFRWFSTAFRSSPWNTSSRCRVKAFASTRVFSVRAFASTTDSSVKALASIFYLPV